MNDLKYMKKKKLPKKFFLTFNQYQFDPLPNSLNGLKTYVLNILVFFFKVTINTTRETQNKYHFNLLIPVVESPASVGPADKLSGRLSQLNRKQNSLLNSIQ